MIGGAVPAGRGSAAAILGVACLILGACDGHGSGGRAMPFPIESEASGVVTVTSPDRRLGGLSALAVIDDPPRMVAVSDRGWVITARIVPDASGAPTGVADMAVRPLLDIDGGPVSGARADAEGLARLPDGRWVVGFERDHRIMIYPADADGPVGVPVVGPVLPGAEALPANAGIEAVTVLSDGRILAIAEGGNGHAGRPAWLCGADGCRATAYEGTPSFRVTAADTLPDGDVLLLERFWSPLGRSAVGLVRVPARRLDAAMPIAGRRILLSDRTVRTENFEGLSVVETESGVRAHLLSDDNFSILQRTLLAFLTLDG